MAKTVKKAQGGASTPRVSLRQGQYKRLGRLAAKDPSKAQDVAERMVERRSRRARGQEYVKKNISKLFPEVPEVKKKGGKVTKKMAKGGSFPDLNKDGKITKADILKGRGVIKNGGKVKTAKGGATLKKQAATAIAMKKAGKAPKKMMGGGKCRYGC